MRYLWSELIQAISQQPRPLSQQASKKIFLSHSTQDGVLLAPVVNYFRKYLDLEIFVCSDSIFTGERWYSKIATTLAEAILYSLCIHPILHRIFVLLR